MTHATDAIHTTRNVPVRVLIVATPMLAWGLVQLVNSAGPAMQCQGSVDTVSAGFDTLRSTGCDVIVAALHGADEFAEMAQHIAEQNTKVLVLSDATDTALLDEAVLSGARGIVHTSDPPATLLKAIDKVHMGELWIDRSATSRIFMKMARVKATEGDDPEKTKIATLTKRERATIAAVTADASAPAKVVASRLCISEHTLRNHLSSIYSKLEVCSRLDLYAYAIRHRLVSVSDRGASLSLVEQAGQRPLRGAPTLMQLRR